MPDPLDLYSFQRGLCLQQGPFLFYAKQQPYRVQISFSD